jgi:hypothetical protein
LLESARNFGPSPGRIEDDAAASPCQGEATTPVVGTPVEILRCAQDDTKKGRCGIWNRTLSRLIEDPVSATCGDTSLSQSLGQENFSCVLWVPSWQNHHLTYPVK